MANNGVWPGIQGGRKTVRAKLDYEAAAKIYEKIREGLALAMEKELKGTYARAIIMVIMQMRFS